MSSPCLRRRAHFGRAIPLVIAGITVGLGAGSPGGANIEELAPLVVRAQAGDLDAYGGLVRRYQEMAYGYAYSILGDFHLSEDATQDAFIEAYRDLKNLRQPPASAAWLRRIVLKRCDRILRRSKLQTVPLEAAAAIASPQPGPPEIAEKREMRDRVLEAIRALPEHERVVTTLFYIDGYSQHEIAGFLEVPVSTVKSRLHTSRRRLEGRLVAMVADGLQSRPLPQQFAEQLKLLVEMPSPVPKESFAIIIQAAAKALGSDADYETVYALSTNGFAPCIATWENEIAHWHVFGRARALDVVAGRFGLSVRKLPVPDAATGEERRAAAAVMREAMERGDVVLTEGGYDYREWSIIADAR
jgi:RNA polymerase sigma factor (sigma-70 family)